MKTIWKFELLPDKAPCAMMPRGAKVLCVQTQNGVPCIWALCDEEEQKVTRRFVVLGTGHDADAAIGAEYVGTFQLPGGKLVFHVFDCGEPSAVEEEG